MIKSGVASNVGAELRLLENYNVPVPRYTSYPTVPNWSSQINADSWVQALRNDIKAGSAAKGISIYVHLPFCESLCTYCGCTKKITKNHGVEGRYIDAVLKEWRIYSEILKSRPLLKELHLGGGTPTFFSVAHLKKLIEGILAFCDVHEEHEFSFEAHPNNTTVEHLQALYDLGFRRLSLGVQDNDKTVQVAINRIQPFENVKNVTEAARRIGYRSVNFDLIYGLPFQSLQSIERTIHEVITLRPERVAFYSYAHVPWTSRGQRLFDENDLPASHEKIKLYRRGREIFLQNGYSDIGMDHFSVPEDDLNLASKEGRLHRNFMGYSTQSTEIMLGLGMSSISSGPSAFSQNAKGLQDYYEYVENGKLAIEKGYLLSDEDRHFARYILDISCRGYTRFRKEDTETLEKICLPKLRKLAFDNLIELDENSVKVTELGRNFIRNICSAFDLYLPRNMEKPGFSKAI